MSEPQANSQHSTCAGKAITALACLVILLSSFLLFQIQPILARVLLPVFGGAPSTWNTCMVFFQSVLLLGYLYSHLSSTYLTSRRALVLHFLLSAAALFMLTYFATVRPHVPAGTTPELAILGFLALAIGLPYFLLATTTPLLQSALTKAGKGSEVYRLYGLSNFGSLLALLSYPVVIEPRVALTSQLNLWVAGFACFVSGAIIFLASTKSQPIPEPTAGEQSRCASTELYWFALAACGTLILMATTNHLCQNVASIPFLWVVPLALYLVSFIVAFSFPSWYSRRIYSALYIIVAALILLVAWVYKVPQFSALLLIFSSFIFLGCTICHAELEQLKPSPKYLTRYYIVTSLGGICGTAAVAFIAPFVFTSYAEMWFAIPLCLILLIPVSRSKFFPPSRRALTVSLVTLALLGAIVIDRSGRDIARVRDFFGVLRVAERNKDVENFHFFRLFHGPVVHGLQFQKPEKRSIPTTYYGEFSGAGLVLKNYRADQARKVGIIGLGVGTLASYATAKDEFLYYEINPQVVKFANSYFSYLGDARGKSETRIGDARNILEQESAQGFDVLIIDAFSGDAIPIHLMTHEALQIYRRHLTPAGGALVFHITNSYMDFVPVLLGLAREAKLHTIFIQDPGVVTLGQRESHYVILTDDAALLQRPALRERGVFLDANAGQWPLWSDEFSDTFSTIKW